MKDGQIMIRSALIEALMLFHRSRQVSSGIGLSSRPSCLLFVLHLCSFVYMCYDTGQRPQNTGTLVLDFPDSTTINQNNFCHLLFYLVSDRHSVCQRKWIKVPSKTIQSLRLQTPKHQCHHSAVVDEPLYINPSLTTYSTSM